MNHTCDGCQYRDHSGAFTSGGARLTCRHPMAKGEQDLPGDTPLSMFLRHGFTEEDAKMNLIGVFGPRNDATKIPGEHHWIRRVRPSDGTAPNWCPEVPPKVLKEHVRILREAVDQFLTPREGTVFGDRLRNLRAALEATKES